MKNTEQQATYDSMERLPLHKAVAWNIRNRDWYKEYTRQYKEVLKKSEKKKEK